MDRELIMFDDKIEEEHYITRMLGVHVNDIVKIRDFCNKIISKIGPAGDYTSDNILIKLEE